MKQLVQSRHRFVGYRHSGSKSREGIETPSKSRSTRTTSSVTAGRKAEKALKHSATSVSLSFATVTAGRKAEKALKLTYTGGGTAEQARHSGSKSREGIETGWLARRGRHSSIRHSGSKSREGIETGRGDSCPDCRGRVTAGRKAEKALKHSVIRLGTARPVVTAGRKAEKALKQATDCRVARRRRVTAGRKAEKALKQHEESDAPDDCRSQRVEKPRRH